MNNYEAEGRSMSREEPRRKAAAMIELAIVLPVLLLLAGGIIDFSRFAYYHVAVSNAAGAGARFACFHPVTTATQSTWNAKTRQAAIDDLQGILGYNVSRLTVPDPSIAVDSGSFQFRRVRVQVDYAFQTLVSWPGIPSAVTIRRAVVMRMVR